MIGVGVHILYVTGFRKTGLIAGLVKIDFILEKASTKFKYILPMQNMSALHSFAFTL